MPDPFSDRLGFDSGFSGASYRLGFGGGIQGGERLGFGGSAFGGTSGNRSFGWDPIDLFAQQAAKESQQWNAPATGGTGIPGATGGVGAPVGQNWANVNRWDSHILRASQETGVPPDIIKAIMMLESQGNPNAVSVSGYYGLMQIGPQSAVPAYMRNRGWLADPYNQVLAGATELRNKYNALGQNWDMAIRGYLGFGTDANGTTDQSYLARVNQYRQQINSTASAPGGLGGPIPGGSGTNNIVQLATQFVGKVPYVWGGIPGKGQSPYGGWDCSGFTYWLDQNYGNGALPMGSHYQFQYAQRTGQLFTNMSMLQPGDLIFIDSGWQGGAGAELNRAGHVAMYAGNGMIVHAANAQEGTILSPLSRYRNILGAMHMGWSGGAGGGFGATPWQQQNASGGNWFNQSLSSILAGARR